MGNKGKGVIALAAAGVLYTVSKVAEKQAGNPVPPDRAFLEKAGIFLLDTLGPELALTFAFAAVLYFVGADLLHTTFGEKLAEGFSNINTKVGDGFTQISSTLATGVAGPKKDMVLRLVDEMRGDEHALKEVARRAYGHAYGSAVDGGDYCSTLENIFFDRALKPGRSYRQDASATLDLNRSEAPDDLVRVEEINQYTLIANVANVPKGTFRHPLRLSSRFPIRADAVIDVLRQCQYEVIVGGETAAAVQGLPPDLSLESLLGRGFSADQGVTTILYDGTHLQIKISKDIPIVAAATPIRIYEKSFIEVSDDQYILRYTQPVNGLKFHMRLEARHFALDTVSVGPQNYWIGDDAKQYVVQQGWPDVGKRHFLNLSIDRWVVPGLVLALHWQVS